MTNTLKHVALALAIAAGCGLAANAQVDNYALRLTAEGAVNCGPLADLSGATDYTVQFWMNPDQWAPCATIMSRANTFGVSLGMEEGSLLLSVGNKTVEAKSPALTTGAWSHVGLYNDGSQTVIEINGEKVAYGAFGPIEAVADQGENFTLGGGFTGRLDDVRIYNKVLRLEEFGQMRHTTLTPFAPQWGDLVAYYKMDMNLCDDLVDYKSIETPDAPVNNHGIMSSTGATLEKVTDNPGLPYLINGAYTANERFYDRAIPRNQYLLANDLIILGVESLPDGHVRTVTPNNHATPSGGVSHLAEWEGRHGVASFDGTGLLTATERTLELPAADDPTYTFETWMYVDQWVEGAYIFRKETADGLHGFSIRLGEPGQIYVRCNGANYGANLGVETGRWHHLGIVPRNTGVKRTTYLFALDGTGKSATASLCDESTDCTPAGVDDVCATVGENFIGKLDETVIWKQNYDVNGIATHSRSIQMPGFDIVLNAAAIQRANTAWLYDRADNIGWDSYSQDHWRDLMTAAYDGYRGYSVRISVKSHTNWQTTIGTAPRRKKFAQDLGEIAKNYDGVELDLEWMDGTQTTLGLLAKEIRNYLPEGKTLFISCHAYGAYRFPLDDMQYVDGFTFQQYGPQKTFFNWDNYTSSVQSFLNYGFPADKIMTSYACTTSRGYVGNDVATVIAGVRDGFFNAEGFTPEANEGQRGEYTYYFTGPRQTYDRAALCTEKGLQGIFYWDMGNDVPVEHPYNLAKWASWGLSPNVDRDIRQVDVRHSNTGVNAVKAEAPTPGRDLGVTVSADGNYLLLNAPASGTARFYTPAGAQAASVHVADTAIPIDTLSAGIYVVTLNGSTARFVKK